MFRRKKDEIDGLEEMCWLLAKEVVQIEEGDITKRQNGENEASINSAQRRKIRLIVFSSIETLVRRKMVGREYVEGRYGDIFVMSKEISDRIIKALKHL